MSIDLEFLEGKRWFAQKGFSSRISITDRVELGKYEILIISAVSDSMSEKYAIPIHTGSGCECDSDPQYLNTLIEKMNLSGTGGNGLTIISGHRQIPQVESVEIHFSGTSNVLCKADGMISKSYRRLRRNNFEADLIIWLRGQNFNSVPDCYGAVKYNSMCLHSFFKFEEGRDTGEIYYGDLLDFLEKKTIGINAWELGRSIRELHRNLVDFIDPPELSKWRWEMKEKMMERLKFLSVILGEPDFRYVDDAAKRFLGMIDHMEKIQMTHGDLHLSQILYYEDCYKFIDFEGEPDHDSPPFFPRERDVASLIRSFDYMIRDLPRNDREMGVRWSNQIAEKIMDGYGVQREQIYPWLLERAIYEICYEAKNRPANVKIPLRGLKELL